MRSLIRLIISLIITLSIALPGLFLANLPVSAQDFNYAQMGEKIPYGCGGENCGIESGVKASENALAHSGIETDTDLTTYIQQIVGYFLTIVSIVGVIYIIWAGFKILTAAGDDGELQKSKKIVLYVAWGIILMWLSFSIVRFIIEKTLRPEVSMSARNYSLLSFIIPDTSAQHAYTENEAGSFLEYKARTQAAIEELETELRLNQGVSLASLQKVRSLVQQAYDRLPDKDSVTVARNESAKRAVDLYISLAMQQPNSQAVVGDAISRIANFINSVQVLSVQGSIIASPLEGNAPLTTSFRATNIKDPSGTIPPTSNYIWWVRENGGRRRELGRGPTLTQIFPNEGTYTIFLDVVSASRNSKGKTDVLPLSTSVQVEVKPKVAEMVLLINGVNVSNKNSIKISPSIASQGILFDASASRAIGNGVITETSWDFGNGNSRTYKGSPVIEREIFATQGTFPARLQFKTNDGQTFQKDIQLVIVDPIATINVEKTVVNIGENVSFRAENQFSDSRNMEYIWQIQDENGKRTIKSSSGLGFNHSFDAVGTYIVTLTAKSPNGGIDNDSKVITVESRGPIASLELPKPISNEQPNTFVFDASRSYDPDTNSRKNLTYNWRVNDQKVTLDNVSEDGSKGTFTFPETGEAIVSVTVSNKYGKVDTQTQTFTVNSILAGSLEVTPQVTQVGKTLVLNAKSENAEFFEWNLGDGSAVLSGNQRAITHAYKTAGTYTVSVKLTRNGSNEATTLTRRIFVGNMNSPMAIIDVSNVSNSTILEPGVCNGKDAYVLNRSETSTINGSNSINIDGNPGNLDYTWRYMGKISTNSSISEIFRELGCYPIELTVRSKTNGETDTTTQYIQLKNQPPTLTNITTNVDATKQDSQKIIVKVSANGANDVDGVITSYTWYYSTESDSEPQGVQITQNPHMTFVLPYITEKYYFGVILEDNDGAKTNSSQLLQGQAPLIIDNEKGNIHMPLITLSVPTKPVKVGEKIRVSVDAKTIMGTNITNKSQYAWDFDGDGVIDKKTDTPTVEYSYPRAGDYTLRVRVTNNGVSNTKYHTILVRNELKASYIGFRLPDNKIYLMNTSRGKFDATAWKIGDFNASDPDGIIVDFADIPQSDTKGNIGNMIVSNGENETSNIDISTQSLLPIAASNTKDSVTVQSSHEIKDNGIVIKDPSDILRLSFLGNNATHYAVDIDTAVDSDLDGIPDNDIDNKNTASYTAGTAFSIADFAYSQKRNRTIKVTLFNGSTPVATRNIQLVLDFLPEASKQTPETTEPGLSHLSELDKARLEEFAEQIRTLPDADRLIIMKQYRTLVENWEIDTERAKNLIDIDSTVSRSTTIPEPTKKAISDTIESLLMRGADTTNKIMVSIKLIRDLIPTKSPNYKVIQEKLDAIESHPNNITENKKLWSEILSLIKTDDTIEDTYKIHIHKELVFITSHEVPQENNKVPGVLVAQKSDGGIFSTIMTILKIAGIILGIILAIVGIAYALYRAKRKDGDTGFQDYIIDSVKGKKDSERAKESIIPRADPLTAIKTKEVNSGVSIENDPLKTYTPPEETTPTPTENPTSEENTKIDDALMPDWLKPERAENTSQENPTNDPLSHENLAPIEKKNTAEETVNTESSLPDWLQAPTGENTPAPEVTPKTEELEKNFWENWTENSLENTWGNSQGGLPDWLQVSNMENAEIPKNGINNAPESASPSDPLDFSLNTPDVMSSSQAPEIPNNETISPNTPENSPENSSIPDWLRPAENTSEKIPAEKSPDETPEHNFLETNIDSSINSNFSYTGSKIAPENSQNENEISTTEGNEAAMPSWLQELSQSKEPTQAVNENTDVISEKKSENIEPITKEQEESLPNWLSESAGLENSENISEKTKFNISEKSEQIEENGSTEMDIHAESPKEKTAKKTKKNKKPEENSVDIPDWLK